MQSIAKTDREVAAWLRLTMAPGLKPAALRMLLNHFGLPDAVLDQPFESLALVTGEASARAILGTPGADFAMQLDAVLAWRDTPGNTLLTLDDPAYPPMLLTMSDPPPLLYVKGCLAPLHACSVAVVGSRNATPQGAEDAQRFSRVFSEAGVVVVSGLALGIDAAAHRGALAGRAGTIAVVGTGADIVYPSTHHGLARDIAATGAILSEWPLGTPARPAHFPQRNRLIAGLVNGVLIVEAAMRSGSLITARLANEMGRDVFALPGSIHAPLSRGCHRMIKQGAKLIETPEDVLEELGAPALPPSDKTVIAGTQLPLLSQNDAAPGALPPDAQRLLDALGHAPATLEILAARTEMDTTALQGALLQLELSGHLTALHGGRYVRAGHRR
ncbi:DNA-processing protein DprA [Paraburkholderia rhizosphaerae]|uniref:DNA protecting protein DprA n=1 Tax=Paraburkholderia rhizosphaerae TaxID=480658 RepID=A0A4R8LQI8_9BURK|nr:DNA-processing protein DprA [Paraburkholderia rhizosphaerae]TDY49810.1 DNA protecting protein DprA [Paraburkholderia rhizosphaerae]